MGEGPGWQLWFRDLPLRLSQRGSAALTNIVRLAKLIFMLMSRMTSLSLA